MMKFEPGQILITKACQATIPDGIVHACLKRHLSGDWGTSADAELNDNSLGPEDPGRLLSVYEYEGLPAFWIITEMDRSATTVLLPDDY